MKTAMFVSSIASACARAFFFRGRHVRPTTRRHHTLAMLLVLMAACDSQAPPETPAAPAPLAFAGSETCRECHAPEFDLWQESHHALAMQQATPDTVLGDFSNVEFRYFDVISTFFTRDGNFLVRTDNAEGELEEFTIKYTFGVTPLQQYLIEMPNGHVQTLSIAWDARSSEEGGQRWYHLYPDEFIMHDDPLHWTRREQNWNYMCAECHSTNLQKNYTVQTDTFATTWTEINVGCEACHGPGSRHVARARSGSGAAGLVVDLDDSGRAVWQMNADTGMAERSELLMRPPQQPEACGRCHARRSLATGDYEYGKPLHDTHAPSLLDEFLYHPDGQILEEVYVYSSFIQSRMYQAGVSCSDCHDPHAARLKTSGAVSDICSTCHLPEKFSSADHHKHKVGDVQCVDCHMTSRTYMGVDDRRDHSFRIPRPDLTSATGSPNACNQCHDDRGADWASSAVDAWYGDSRKTHYAEAIHAGRSGSPSANELLIGAITNSDYPGIARATALSLLRPPYSGAIVTEIRRNLANPDSLIRSAALTALAAAAPELIVEWAEQLLSDPVRSVRIEAARIVSPLQASLSGQRLRAFQLANEERIAAQHAIAERPEAHINLGNVHMEAGDAAQAEAALLQALRLEPRAAAARVNIAQLYVQTGRGEEAQQILRDGIAMNADQAVLHHSLGLILVRADQHDAALPELAAAASLQPDEPRFVYVYAVALNSLGRAAEAIALLQDATQRFPADFDMHWALATMLRDQGRLDEATEVATRLAEIYPQVEAVQDLLQSL
jgi:tetratricopeptide (TPR) repeat protein